MFFSVLTGLFPWQCPRYNCVVASCGREEGTPVEMLKLKPVNLLSKVAQIMLKSLDQAVVGFWWDSCNISWDFRAEDSTYLTCINAVPLAVPSSHGNLKAEEET